jgi:two-component system, OmpR family, sensor histidine kinase CpxA
MPVRTSLFTRILFWSFLNLAAVGSLLFAFFGLQFRLGPDSALFAGNRLQFVAARLSAEVRDASSADRGGILARYSSQYSVDFALFGEDAAQVAGQPITLPTEVTTLMRESPRPNPPAGGRGQNQSGRLPGSGGGPGRGGPPEPREPSFGGVFGGMPPAVREPGRGGLHPPGQPIFRVRTSDPTRYWMGMHVPLFEPGERRPTFVTLLVVSDSMSGHGLFFDIRPWLFMAAAIIVLSMAIWFPFVRGLTRSIGQMTATAEEMARGGFDARVDVPRTDELGRLGTAINQLSARLAGFVGGQRRFLGDISHELNTPLARLDVALGIIEEQVGQSGGQMVADAQEEVRLMAQLVGELLQFAKAGMKGQEIRLGPVPLRKACDVVVAREASGHDVVVDVSPELTVHAQGQLLSRAVANLVRNAIRYAGQAGPITVGARSVEDQVVLTVSDRGPGVPEGALPRLFEPFFRIEPDRDRATGGAGLGLAIVKTCVDACGGQVSARNLSPGFEVEIRLRRA